MVAVFVYVWYMYGMALSYQPCFSVPHQRLNIPRTHIRLPSPGCYGEPAPKPHDRRDNRLH